MRMMDVARNDEARPKTLDLLQKVGAAKRAINKASSRPVNHQYIDSLGLECCKRGVPLILPEKIRPKDPQGWSSFFPGLKDGCFVAKQCSVCEKTVGMLSPAGIGFVIAKDHDLVLVGQCAEPRIEVRNIPLTSVVGKVTGMK